MSELQYTTVDRVLAKFHRDLRGTNINESDAIEWIGEALDFLKVPQIQEEAVAFVEVKDYHADLPNGFHNILQIARNNNWTSTNKNSVCPNTVTEEVSEGEATCPVVIDCHGKPITDYELAYYRPFFDLKWEYEMWTNGRYYRENYTPVRLSNNLFFNSLVCKEKNNNDIYKTCEDEYTIVGNQQKRLRFSFKEGSVAVAYLKNQLDNETGYPLIPDNVSYMTAITYYIKWKISEWYAWNGREGYVSIAQDSERKWLKYAKQSKNFMKMPKNIDTYQNLLEQSHYLIPRHKRYYGFFGNLGKAENKNFNNNNR